MLDHIDLENELHPKIFYWCVNGSNNILFRGVYFYTVHFCLWYSPDGSCDEIAYHKSIGKLLGEECLQVEQTNGSKDRRQIEDTSAYMF